LAFCLVKIYSHFSSRWELHGFDDDIPKIVSVLKRKGDPSSAERRRRGIGMYSTRCACWLTKTNTTNIPIVTAVQCIRTYAL